MIKATLRHLPLALAACVIIAGSAFADFKVMSSGSVYTTLADAVTNAATTDEIRVSSGTYNNFTGTVTITSNLTIVGGCDASYNLPAGVVAEGDTVLDGSGAAPTRPILVDTAVTVTMKNLTCTNANTTTGGRGGYIRAQGGPTLNLENCHFSTNFNNDRGAALYFSNAIVTMTNTTVHDNQAFVDTVAQTGGRAAIAWDNAATVVNMTDCDVYSNTTGDRGCAVYFAAGAMNALRCNFRYNVQVQKTPPVTISQLNGGTASLTMEDCNIEDNAAYGISVTTNCPTVIKNCTIARNVIDGTWGWGFETFGNATATVTDSIIDSNGQGLFAGQSSLLVERCQVTNNLNDGVGLAASDGSPSLLTVKNCNLQWNSFGAKGGGGSLSTATIEDTTIDGNFINAVELSATDSYLTRCTIKNHPVTVIKSGGGNLHVTDCTVKDNSGSYFDWWGESMGTIENTVFENNTGGAGTIWSSSPTPDKTFKNCTWRNNTIIDRLLWLDGGPATLNVTIDGCNFLNNTGDLYKADPKLIVAGWTNLNLVVKDSKFEGNTRDTSFGSSWPYMHVIDMFGVATDGTVITGNTFKNNDGTPIWIEMADDPETIPAAHKVEVSNNMLVGNLYGGSVYVGNLDVLLANNMMVKNSVPVGSGGEVVAITSWDVTVSKTVVNPDTGEETVFENNFKPTLTLTNNTLADNYGEGWRGGRSGSIHQHHCLFKQ